MTNTKSAVQTSNQPISDLRADEFQMARDLLEYAKEYAREKPEVAALYCFGIGFILGWKLKPW